MFKFLKEYIKKLNNKKILNKFSLINSNNTLINTSSSKKIKRFMTKDDSLSIAFEQEMIKSEINTKAKEIIKQAINNPEILVEYIIKQGTVVTKSKQMKTCLFLIGEKEGFIPPMSGIKAYIFSLINNIISDIKIPVGFSTPAIFALDDKPANVYFLSFHFHLWLSYMKELDGFDNKTRKHFNSVWNSNFSTETFSNMSVDQIVSLKDVIARENEAIAFVQEMAKELVGQKMSLQKLKQGKSISL